MKKIILVLALCATFVTSAFADETQGQVVGSGEIPEATAQAQQASPPQTPAEEPKQETVKEDCPPVQVQAPVTPPADDCPKEEPRIVHQTSTRTIIRYKTVNNRTIVREVDNRELKKVMCELNARLDARFQMTKRYTDAKADQAYVGSVGTASRYTDAKVDGLRKELAPRLDAVEEQSNALALVALVLGIIALVGLIMWGITRR